MSNHNDHSALGIGFERPQCRYRIVRVVSHGNDVTIKQGDEIAFTKPLTVPREFGTNRFGDSQVAFLLVQFDSSAIR